MRIHPQCLVVLLGCLSFQSACRPSLAQVRDQVMVQLENPNAGKRCDAAELLGYASEGKPPVEFVLPLLRALDLPASPTQTGYLLKTLALTGAPEAARAIDHYLQSADPELRNQAKEARVRWMLRNLRGLDEEPQAVPATEGSPRDERGL